MILCHGFFPLELPSSSTLPWPVSGTLDLPRYVWFWLSNPTIRGLVGDPTLVIGYLFSQHHPICRHRVLTRGVSVTCLQQGICKSVEKMWAWNIHFIDDVLRLGWSLCLNGCVALISKQLSSRYLHAEQVFTQIVSRHLQHTRYDCPDPMGNINSLF